MTRDVTFGVNLDPGIAPSAGLVEFARRAEADGFELIAIQDHPYNDRFYDTWSLLVHLMAKTERIAFTPNVANLGLRPPAMLAKAAASLAALEPGRVVLGLGAGAAGAGVPGMGGTERRGKAVVEYARDSIAVIRSAFAGGIVRKETDQVSVRGYRAGPVPPESVPLWVGSHQRRMLALTGELADGWFSGISTVLTKDEIPWRQDLIDEAAVQAGRAPSDVRRIHNIAGVVGRSNGHGYGGSAADWAERLTEFVLNDRFDGFVFWPMADPAAQAQLFAGEVIPAARAALAAETGSR